MQNLDLTKEEMKVGGDCLGRRRQARGGRGGKGGPGKGRGGQMCSKYIRYMYENVMMKTIIATINIG
jgi:hypothetical protein